MDKMAQKSTLEEKSIHKSNLNVLKIKTPLQLAHVNELHAQKEDTES